MIDEIFEINLSLDDNVLMCKVEEDALGNVLGRFSLRSVWRVKNKFRLSVKLYSCTWDNLYLKKSFVGNVEEINKQMEYLNLKLNLAKK